jgi:hypothetical protein
VAKGIQEAEHSDLQRLWGCNRLDSAILQKGSEASTRFFKGQRLPIQDWVKPDFLIKNHTKGQRILQVHSSSFDKGKGKKQNNCVFQNFSLP